MKKLLIAAGMAASMLFAAPALAAPVGHGALAISAPQDMRDHRGDDRRDDRRMDRRDDRRGDRGWNGRGDRRGDRGWRGNDRRYGWNARRCHNERRHGRWVRICRR